VTLAVCLVSLGEGASASERNAAAAKLLSLLRSWAPGFLRKNAPGRLDDDDIDECVQHLLTRCATGTSRFRGQSEGEAHSWCMRVLVNKARDVRRQKRDLLRVYEGSEADTMHPELEIPVAPNLDPIAADEFISILEMVEGEVPRLHRAQDAGTLARALRCHVEARLGATIEEQIEAYGWSGTEGPRDATGAARARNRVYQYRARGRTAGCEALRSLVAQGRLPIEDVAQAHRFLGCEVRNDATEWEKAS
jgi:DNA-directed RNA polymerase specialized sigma24 family protein